jgi:mannose-6-phosphate isomerase-like protein (cupin superfamily)
MKGFIANIQQLSLENSYFRKVLYTTKNSQLVIMSLQPKEEIGEETHPLDQTITIVEGNGKAVLDGVETSVMNGSIVIVPKGTKHNIVNTSEDHDLKLYTLYTPPDHKDGLIHETKEDAEKEDQPFDGKTTE